MTRIISSNNKSTHNASSDMENSQFSFSNGNMLSSLHILLRERRETGRDGETHRSIIINTAMHNQEQHKLKYSKLDLLNLEH